MMKNGYKKRLLSFVVVLSMFLTSVAGGKVVSAAEPQIWGEGGTTLTWTGSVGEDITITVENNIMTVTGTGAMGTYSNPTKVDYAAVASSLTTVNIQSGITAVGNMNFVNFTALEMVTIAETVTKIGANAFSGATVATIDIKGQLEEVGTSAFGNSKSAAVKKIIVHDENSYELVKAKAKLKSGEEDTTGTDLVLETDADQLEQQKQALQELVNETRENYKQEDYTEASYNALDQALSDAEQLLKNEQATAEDFIGVTKAINTAISKLKLKFDATKEELNTAIADANKKKENKDYTTSSVAALKEALAAAEEAYQNGEATLEDIQKAKEALEEASAEDETGLAEKGLKRKADSAHQNSLNIPPKKAELYTEESYAEYQEVLDEINKMKKNLDDITNQQVEAVLEKLKKAEEKLELDAKYTVDYTEYEAAKEAVLAILEDENSPYTKSSLASLQTLYDNQSARIENDEGYRNDRTQEQVDDVASILKNAIDPESKSYRLVEKGDTTELTALVASAEQLDGSKYTAESWKTLSTRLAEAKALLNDPDNAKKADIEASMSELQKAMDGLVEKKEEPSPTPGGDDTKPSPTPGGDDTQPSPTPGGDDTQPSPTPGGDDIQPSPTPGGDDTKPSPTPGGDDTQPSPTPGGDVTQPSPTPGEDETQPTKSPDDTGKVSVKKVTIKKASSPKKKTLKIIWKKVSDVTGYQIMIGTDKKITKNKKTITVKGAKAVNKTIGKLKSKKTYYVKVRAYKVVGGKKYYGDWSQVKVTKVK